MPPPGMVLKNTTAFPPVPSFATGVVRSRGGTSAATTSRPDLLVPKKTNGRKAPKAPQDQPVVSAGSSSTPLRFLFYTLRFDGVRKEREPQGRLAAFVALSNREPLLHEHSSRLHRLSVHVAAQFYSLEQWVSSFHPRSASRVLLELLFSSLKAKGIERWGVNTLRKPIQSNPQ